MDTAPRHPPQGTHQSLKQAAKTQLVEHHSVSARELAEALSTLVPLAEPPSGAVSSTFASAFGARAMSVPRSARSTALALVHELQHSKFAALSQLYELVDDEPPDLYYAPRIGSP